MLGTTLVLPTMAGAQPEDTTTTTAGDTTTTTAEATTTTTLAEPVNTTTSIILACVSNPDFSSVVGPLNIPLQVSIDALADAAVGETVPFSGTWTISLTPGLVQIASVAGLATIGVQDFALSASASGGLSGGPFSASPSTFDIPVAAPSSFSGTLDGSVTVTEAGGGTLNLASPFSMTVTVVVPGVPLPPLAATCNPDVTQVLKIGAGGPTTPTTGGPTTTAKPGGPTPGSPRFTG